MKIHTYGGVNLEITEESLENNWKIFKLVNDNQISVGILNYGGIITEIMVPDKNGKVENIVLGYEKYHDYARDSNFFGAIIGRVAGRIQGASFKLGGETYPLEKNEGNHHLHSGKTGFNKVVWQAEPFYTNEAVGLKLHHYSPHNDGGYPGALNVTVTYTLHSENKLSIDYEAKSDRASILTLTNHTYFNLSGNLKRSIHEHKITMNSKHFIELDKELIPTGNFIDVTGTSFDFRKGRKLAEGLNNKNQQNEIVGSGYDHYFVFNEKEREAVVFEESSGRILKLETDQPGMVMYTGNNLEEGLRLNYGKSRKHLGVCFETQASPASLYHEGFPSIYVDKDEKYSKRTTFTFEV